MGLSIMIAGLVVFLGAHVFVTMRDARGALIARIGEGAYKGLFSAVSFFGLALIVYGYGQYRAHEWVDVWYPPVWARHLALLLVLPAIVLIVSAYVRGNIQRTLKHPMLAGVKLWAVAHLIANGDLGSIILFGAVLTCAVFDRITLKRRSDPGAPDLPAGGWPRDAAAIAVGLVVYVALGSLFHPYAIGVPVFTS